MIIVDYSITTTITNTTNTNTTNATIIVISSLLLIIIYSCLPSYKLLSNIKKMHLN